MPRDNLPPFLQQEAQRLVVTWNKANNYFVTFAKLWYEMKAEFDTGKYDDRRGELKFGGTTFEAWVFEMGLPPHFITQMLKVFENAIDAETRRQNEQALADIQRAKREAAEAKRAEAQARRAAAAERRAQEAAVQAARKAERETARAAQQAPEPTSPVVANGATPEPIITPPPPPEPKRARGRPGDPNSPEAIRKRKEREKQRYDRLRARQLEERAASGGGTTPELNALLAELRQLTETQRIQRGRIYAQMRRICQNGQAGCPGFYKNSKLTWSWRGWAQVCLKGTKISDIEKCIAEYEDFQSVSDSPRTNGADKSFVHAAMPN